MSADINEDARAVLAALDNVWQTFDEISPQRDMTRRSVRVALSRLKRLGLVESRLSEALGRVEYAITEAGDEELGYV